nr:hypothetical protein [Tanacetum cinerariifolium]
VALISTPEEKCQAWFMASVEIIKDLADHDEFNALKNQVSLIKKHKADEIDQLTERISNFKSS